MGSLRNTRKMVLLCLFLHVFLAGISPSVSSKLYVVYMGSKDSDDPDEILRANYQMLTAIHKGSYKCAVMKKPGPLMFIVIDMVSEDLRPSCLKNKPLKWFKRRRMKSHINKVNS